MDPRGIPSLTEEDLALGKGYGRDREWVRSFEQKPAGQFALCYAREHGERMEEAVVAVAALYASILEALELPEVPYKRLVEVSEDIHEADEAAWEGKLRPIIERMGGQNRNYLALVAAADELG